MLTYNAIEGKECENNVFNINEVTLFHLTGKLAEAKDMSNWSIRAFLYSAIDDYLRSVSLKEAKFDSHILTRALKYMEKHKRNDISIGDVASAIGYSKGHLSYCINKVTHINFATLLSILRIEDARIMLKDTKKSILEVALYCGFGSERSFYRQFKNITGSSPRDYKKTQTFKVKSTH